MVRIVQFPNRENDLLRSRTEHISLNSYSFFEIIVVLDFKLQDKQLLLFTQLTLILPKLPKHQKHSFSALYALNFQPFSAQIQR